MNMTNLLWAIILVGTFVTVGYILVNPEILDEYDSKCLDSMAKSLCEEKNYTWGKASRALAGNIGDSTKIQCYNDERDFYPANEFKFIDYEKFVCEK